MDAEKLISEQSAVSLSNQFADKAEKENIQHIGRQPLVTFITDDGSSDDWNKLKPLSETYGIPMVAALISDQQSLTQAQVLYMQDVLGWEIASHSKTHPLLSTLSDSQIEDELRLSKEELTSRGYKVKNIVYPGGSHNASVRRIAKKYYRCGASVSHPDGTNKGVIPSFDIKRVGLGAWFDPNVPVGLPANNTLEYYKYRVDQVESEGGWLIFMLHPSDASHTATQQSYLEQIIQYVQAKNLPVVTLDEGFDTYGNALELGDFNRSTTGVAINKVGEIANFPNNLAIKDSSGITATTPISSFTKNSISVMSFLSTQAAGFPTSVGTLFTHRVFETDDELSFQVWHDYFSEKMYRRRWRTAGWTAWSEYATTSYVDTSRNIQKIAKTGITASTLITGFTAGIITTTSFLSGDSAGFPTSVGTLFTYRLSTDNDFGFQMWYDYFSTKMYRRRWNTSAWQPWDEYVSKAYFEASQFHTIATATNPYTAAQLATAYPNYKITSFSVNGAGATGFPSDSAGVVTVYRTGGGNGFDRQEFRKFNSNELWSRYADATTGAWTAWVKISAV